MHVSAAEHRRRRSSRRSTPYVEGDCLVAIDAPLIVTNATGNRPAEAALNKDFARFDAGAHPSNTGKPEFREQPRGARIAARLGLDMNPRSGRSRRAIEVYPHPATVALFRLGRTLKYKNKPGRDLEQLRSELIVLVGLLEGLATADPPLLRRRPPGRPAARLPPWQALRSAVETAGRKSELRVVEDQVDAVVCAYVALFATREPGPDHDVRRLRDRLHRHPDPARRTSSRRRAGRGSRPEVSDPGGSAVREYAEQQPALRLAADQFVAAGDLDPRRRRHQLPERDRAGEVGGVVRGQGRPHRRRHGRRSPTRCARSPTRSGSG